MEITSPAGVLLFLLSLNLAVRTVCFFGSYGVFGKQTTVRGANISVDGCAVLARL